MTSSILDYITRISRRVVLDLDILELSVDYNENATLLLYIIKVICKDAFYSHFLLPSDIHL